MFCLKKEFGLVTRENAHDARLGDDFSKAIMDIDLKHLHYARPIGDSAIPAYVRDRLITKEQGELLLHLPVEEAKEQIKMLNEMLGNKHKKLLVKLAKKVFEKTEIMGDEAFFKIMEEAGFAVDEMRLAYEELKQQGEAPSAPGRG